MKDYLHLHNTYRDFEGSFLEKRLVFEVGGGTDAGPSGAEAAEAEGTAPDPAEAERQAQLEQAKADGSDFLKENRVAMHSGMEFDAKDVVYAGEGDAREVVSVKLTFKNIGMEIKKDTPYENIQKAGVYVLKLSQNQFDGFKFREESNFNLDTLEATLHINMKETVDGAFPDTLTISMADDTIQTFHLEITPPVAEGSEFDAYLKASLIGKKIDDVHMELLEDISQKAEEMGVLQDLAGAEVTEVDTEALAERQARIASFEGDEVSLSSLEGFDKLMSVYSGEVGETKKLILREGGSVAQITVTHEEDGFRGSIVDGDTGEERAMDISVDKEAGRLSMEIDGKRGTIERDAENNRMIITTNQEDGSTRTLYIGARMTELVDGEEVPVDNPPTLFRNDLQASSTPESETPQKEEDKDEAPGNVQEVTLAQLRDLQSSLTTDKLASLVGTTYKLKDSPLGISFTVREGDKGPQLAASMAGGNEYVVEGLAQGEGLSFTSGNTQVDLFPGRHGVDMKIDGQWNGEPIEGKFQTNKEGGVIFKGKVSGKKLAGVVDTDLGTIDPNPRLFRNKDTTRELKETFEGFLGTLQDFLAEAMAMLEEMGILDLFGMSLNKNNDKDTQASLFVLRNKLGTKNTGKLKTIKATDMMGAMTDSTAQTLTNLKNLGLETSGSKGSALMKVIGKIAEIQSNNEGKPAIQGNESITDYLRRTKMVDKNGFWSADYQSYDPEAQPEQEDGGGTAEEGGEKVAEGDGATEKETAAQKLLTAQGQIKENLELLDPEKIKKVAESFVGNDTFYFNSEKPLSFDTEDLPQLQALFETQLSDLANQPMEDTAELIGSDPKKQESVIQILSFLHEPSQGKYTGPIKLAELYKVKEIAKEKSIDSSLVTLGDLFVAMHGGLKDWFEPDKKVASAE